MKTDFLGLLEALDERDVTHVLVGGVAAVLQGAPVTTVDVDVVFRVEAENIRRLERALEDVEARYRDPTGRVIRPTAERLRTNRVNLLQTTIGLLDAMQSIDPGWSYDEVLGRSHVFELEGLCVDVLDLAAVIESKEAADRERDRAVLPVLRRTLEMRDGT